AAGDPPARRWLSRPILIRARPKRTPAPARLAPGHPGARQDVRIPGRRERSFGMETELFATSTGRRERVSAITGDGARFPARAARGGVLEVFVPHATAGLALMELGARSDEDLLAVLAELLPPDDRWRHAHGSRGHGRSHVLPAFLAPFLVIPVLGGAMALGTWQAVALVDLNVDNPERPVRASNPG